MSKKIAISNQKGGVGKTDLCVNLGASLAKLGKKVLIIDLDPQSNTTSYLLGESASLSSHDVLTNENVGAKEAIKNTPFENLDIMPGHIDLCAAQIQLLNDVDMQFKLKQKLNQLRGYDYVIMDTPPSLGVLTVNALAAADEVVIPIQTHYLALEGVAKLVDTIEAVKKSINPRLNIGGVVLTMYDKRARLTAEVEKEVKKSFSEKVFKTVIPVNIKLVGDG